MRSSAEWMNSARSTPSTVGDATRSRSSVASAPFTWHCYESDFKMEFMGGLMAPALDVTGQRVRAATGWAIRDAGDSIEG